MTIIGRSRTRGHKMSAGPGNQNTFSVVLLTLNTYLVVFVHTLYFICTYVQFICTYIAMFIISTTLKSFFSNEVQTLLP